MVVFVGFNRLVLYLFVLSLAIILPSDAALVGGVVDNILFGADKVIVGGIVKPILCIVKEAVILGSTCIYLRVEGLDKTIFEGDVLSVGHVVTIMSGGTHLVTIARASCKWNKNITKTHDKYQAALLAGVFNPNRACITR